MTYVPLIGLGVAVVLGFAGFYYFRANRKRTKLRYDTTSERLFASGGVSTVTIDGKAVDEPYEVRLWFQPTGIKDITSSAFDSNDELAIDLGAPLVTKPKSADSRLRLTGEPGDTRVVVPPQMLKCGPLIYASMIVDGAPKTVLEGALADVDVVQFDVADAGRQTLTGLVSSRRSAPVVVGLVTTGVGVALAAAPVIISWVVDPPPTPPTEQRLNEAVAEAMREVGVIGSLGEVGAGTTARAEEDARLNFIVRQAIEDALNSRGITIGPPAIKVPGGMTGPSGIPGVLTGPGGLLGEMTGPSGLAPSGPP